MQVVQLLERHDEERNIQIRLLLRVESQVSTVITKQICHDQAKKDHMSTNALLKRLLLAWETKEQPLRRGLVDAPLLLNLLGSILVFTTVESLWMSS